MNTATPSSASPTVLRLYLHVSDSKLCEVYTDISTLQVRKLRPRKLNTFPRLSASLCSLTSMAVIPFTLSGAKVETQLYGLRILHTLRIQSISRMSFLKALVNVTWMCCAWSAAHSLSPGTRWQGLSSNRRGGHGALPRASHPAQHWTAAVSVNPHNNLRSVISTSQMSKLRLGELKHKSQGPHLVSGRVHI